MSAAPSRVWTVARRELRGYFDYPTAYILLLAFLALGLFLTLRTVFATSSATMRPFFDLLPWFFALFVPAITMRSLAEERRSRTLEWLLAQPLGERDVVLGKFLGDWIFVLLALAGTLPAGIGILLASSADPGILLSQYIGAALLAALTTALGLWASSVTRNQITAFILAASVSLLLMLIGMTVVTIGLPPVLAGIVTRLSVLPHFENVARGVVDLRDVLYFVSVTLLFLVLAGTALSRERLSRTRGAWHRLRLGAWVAAGAIVVTNLLGGYLHGRLDLTRDRLFTLAPGTRDLVRNLKDVVQIKLFVSRELPPEVQLVLRDVRDLLADYRRSANGNLRITEINPDADSTTAREAQALGVQPSDFSVLRNDEFQMKRGWFGLAVTYANERRVIPVIDNTDDLEFRLDSYIKALTTTVHPRVAFLTFGGAHAPYDYQALNQALNQRYTLTTLDSTQLGSLTPDSVKVAVLAGPQQAIGQAEAEQITQYVDRGGAALLLLENNRISPQVPFPQPLDPGVGALLTAHGVRALPGLVFDLQSNARVSMGNQGGFSMITGYPLWPTLVPSGQHATTRSLRNLSVAWAQAFEIRDSAQATAIWQTTPNGGVRSFDLPIVPGQLTFDPSQRTQPEVVAVAVDAGKVNPLERGRNPLTSGARGGRMVVVGDADFIADRFVQNNPQNLIFAANAIDWLAQDESLIRIRSKHRTPPTLAFSSTVRSNLYHYGNLVGVPLLVALIGFWRITRRERRARQAWGEAQGAGGGKSA